MRHSALRLAAVRTLAIWLALYGAILATRASLLAIPLCVLVVWLASLLLRRPDLFARAVAASVVVMLVIAATGVHWDGSQMPRLRAREVEAFEYLRNAEQVEAPVVGFAAQFSGGYLAMRILHRSPHADAAFKALIRSGTPAGRIYGLMGVRKTDRLYFEVVSRAYGRGSVETFSGCLMGDQPVAELLAGADWFDASLFPEREVRAAEAAYRFTKR